MTPPTALADPAAETSDDQGITFSGLDPVLGSLGEMVGLLDPGAAAGEYALDPNWFSDPLSNTASGVKQNPQAFVKLLAQVLGQVGGQALGVPVQDPALLGTWYPIQDPTTTPAQPTGLYLVAYPVDPAQPDGDQVFGLGVYHQWKVPSGTPLLQADAWGMAPILRMGSGGLSPVLDTPGFPMTVGVAVEGVDSKPLVDTAGVRFNGVKVSAGLDVADTQNPLQFSLVVMQLQLPGDAAPADRSLADLEAISGQQVLNTAASLFLTALGQLSQEAEDRASYLLPALGISSTVPGVATQLPQLRWDLLLQAVIDGGDAAQPFRDWFQAITAAPELVGTWLQAIAGFVGQTGITVSGDGSRLSPFGAPILAVPSIGTLSFTLGTAVDAAGGRTVYPGLDFAAAPFNLGSTAALTMQASLELAQFTVTGTGAGAVAPTLNFDAGFTLANQTAGQPLAAAGGYSFGSLQAGVALGLGPTVVPSFQLTSVVTPDAEFGTVDLLSPGQLATVAASVVQSALVSLLGVADQTVPFASNVAALLGVINPTVPQGQTWPADLAPPFSVSQIGTTIQDPLGAMAGWYQRMLTTSEQVGGAQAFTVMIGELASLLASASGGGVQVSVSGAGTQSSPWRAVIALSDTTLPAALTGYQVAAGTDVTRLVLGIELGPQITVGGVLIEPSLVAEFLSLDLPRSGSSASVSALWAPRVAAQMLLPNGFTTPEIATAKLQVTSASLSAGWSRTDGWGWSLFAGSPVLWIGDTQIPVGQDLNFSDTQSLQDLVLDGGAAFAPVLSGVLGVALLRWGGRAGLAMTGALGLLPDLDQAEGYPAGFQWPQGMPQLAVTSLSDPFPQVYAQLAAVLATPAYAQAALGLVGYAANGGGTVPSVTGSGTLADPWSVPLPAGFEAMVWYAGGSAQVAGVGLARTDVYTYGTALQATVRSRLSFIEVSLASGGLYSDPAVPALTVEATLAAPGGGLLVDLPSIGASLGSLVLGITVTLDGTTPVVTPVVTLRQATLPGQAVQAQVTLADFQAFTGDLQQAFLTLVNDGIQAGVAQLWNVAGFQQAYSLLAGMGLVLPATGQDGTYGINPTGWMALLADPAGFTRQQLLALLTDPAQRSSFFALMQQLAGVQVPDIPAQAIAVLQALGIVGASEQGYPLLPDALLELAQHPFQTLTTRFTALVNDPVARAALVSALAGDQSLPFGPFTFSSTGGTSVTLALPPANALNVGGVLLVSGSVSFNLQDLGLTATLQAYAPTVGLSTVSSLSLAFSGSTATPTFEVQVVWGDGTRPAADAVTLYPFDSGDFLNQLAAVAPAYVLNVLVNAVVESQLLQKYPLLQQLFEGLGMAQDADGTWTMPSLLGLLQDPRGWLLSNGILGADGQFSLAAFGELLSKLPAVTSSNGIAVGPVASGAQVTGLPYGFSVTATSTASAATISVATSGLDIAQGYGTLQELGLSVSLGADAQPGIAGTLTLQTGSKISSTPYFVSAGYDHAFTLGVGQGSPSAPAGLSLQLVPFMGWGSLLDAVEQALPSILLKQVVPQLISALQANPDTKAFADQLQSVGNQLGASELADALAAVSPVTLQGLEQAALGWLLDRFNAQNAQNTAQAVASLFTNVVSGVTAADGLVRYRPSADIPITLLVGSDNSTGTTLLGLWAELDLPSSELLKASISRTGIGVPLNDPGSPVFSFGVVLTVPVDLSTGPQLSLAWVPGTGVVLAIDPLGDADDTSTHSTLYRTLFPQFFPGGDPTDEVTSWVIDVITQVLPQYVAAVVLNTGTVKTWLTAPIVDATGAPTPLFLLEATSLVVSQGTGDQTRYALNSLSNLLALTPEIFLGNLLKALMQNEITLLTFGAGGSGSISIGPNAAAAGQFGVRVAAPDLAVPGLANVVLQLGDPDTAWIGQAGGNAALLPGLSLYVPISGTGASVSPEFQNLVLNFVNVGVDFTGTQGAPLVNLSRFQLGAVKPRALVSLQMNNWSPTVSFGAEATLQAIGISLAPNTLASGADTNPIAQNLLGSGTDSSESNPPSNPTFSASAGYAGTLWVQLESDQQGAPADQIVLAVQRSFGPLYVGSVGIGWEATPKLLDFLFTGNVALAGLEVDVVGLTVGVPVTDPTNFSAYAFDLQGLNVSFQGGAVSISGGFLKTTNPLSYTGAALIRATKFSVMAIGSYAVVDDEPSLFVFGALQAPLGGVPAFFVTGVAAGFAYNRDIILPAVGDVQNFPLVSGVVNGTFTEGESPESALQALGNVVPPRVGQYWVAAGLTFTSFELLNSVALLFVSFGRDFEIGLVGLTRASFPPLAPRSVALAYVELAFKVSIRPTEGVISAEAQLTPNSFVIAQDCKLTGGFAFYLWFKDIQGDGYTIPAGDFVVTLGGYHPAFTPPKWYPTVPRLGFNWLIDAGGAGSVSVSGGAYFAVVPTAMMAGGYLRVVFTAGPLRAWLDAYANFLIEWKPFYYDITVGVSVGVAFQTTVLGVTVTLKVELGADLWLAGPPTHGQVDVHWYVISFTIPFGEGAPADDNNLTWADFERSFLPAAQPQTQAVAGGTTMLLADEDASGDYPRAGQQVVKLSVQSGLLQDGDSWLVKAYPFELRVDTAIPAPSVTVTASGDPASGAAVGVRPMGMTGQLQTPLTVTVYDATNTPVNLQERNFGLPVVLNGSPAALWGQDALSTTVAPSSTGMVLTGTLLGLVLQGNQYVAWGGVGPFGLSNLEYDKGSVRTLPYRFTPAFAPATPYPQGSALAELQSTIMNPTVAAARDDVYLALQGAGVAAPTGPDLSVMASSADVVLQAPPVLAAVGVFQNNGQPGWAGVAMVDPSEPAEAELKQAPRPLEPQVVGVRRRWRTAAPEGTGPARAAAPHDGVLPQAPRFTERWVDHTQRRSGPALASLRAAAGGGAPAAALHEGTLALWRVDHAQDHALRHEGELSARATCWDRHGELLADLHLEPGAAAALPAGTGRVAVQGVAPAEGPLGWRRESVLTRVVEGYALGDGFALRTQNLNRLRRRGRRAGLGSFEVSDLLAGNLATHPGGARPGWVETVFHHPSRTFVVAVEGDAAGAPVRVNAALAAAPGARGAPAVEPESVEARGGATLLTFRLSEAAPGAAYLNVLVLPLDAGVRLLGVFALPDAEAAGAAPAERMARPLYFAALPPEHARPPVARVAFAPAAELFTPAQDAAS